MVEDTRQGLDNEPRLRKKSYRIHTSLQREWNKEERTETYTSSHLYFACIFSAPDSILTRLANSEIDLGFSYSLSFFPWQVLMSIEMAKG